jgi:hypothetical protein
MPVMALRKNLILRGCEKSLHRHCGWFETRPGFAGMLLTMT